MAFQDCPNIAEISMNYIQGVQPVSNVYHVFNSAGWDAASLTACALIFDGWRTTFLQPLQSSELIAQNVVARDLTTQFAPSIEIPAGSPTGGADASGDLPNNVTAAIKAETGLRGRAYRGRSYWLGLTTAQVTNNTLNSSTASAILLAMEQIGLLLIAAGEVLVVLSRQLNNVIRPTGVGTPVTGWAWADLTLDSQRGRLPGHRS